MPNNYRQKYANTRDTMECARFAFTRKDSGKVMKRLWKKLILGITRLLLKGVSGYHVHQNPETKNTEKPELCHPEIFGEGTHGPVRISPGGHTEKQVDQFVEAVKKVWKPEIPPESAH